VNDTLMNSESTALYLEENRRWRFDWLLPALSQPRQTFARIVASEASSWLTPVVVLMLTALVRVVVAGSIKQAAAATGQITLPPGFEFYTPEQQAQFQQAMSATSGPVFTYVLPAVLAVLGVLVGWLVIGWLLHLVLTLLGGRSSSSQMLNIAAWASLPFAVRDIIRIVAMLNSEQLLDYPGLAGFAPGGEGSGALFLAALLALVDLFLLWHIYLLGVGVRRSDTLPAAKAWGAIILTVLLVLLVRATPALIAAQFSDLTIIRPFF
jgi:hypothetical protein